jgi:hypothetical protein
MGPGEYYACQHEIPYTSSFHHELAHARYAFGIGRKQSYALLQGAAGTLMLQFFLGRLT